MNERQNERQSERQNGRQANVAPVLPLRVLVAERGRFGAYARLVQVVAEVGDRVHPALAQLRDVIARDVAPAVAADDDAEFAALVAAVKALVEAPMRLIETLVTPLAAHRDWLPDLFAPTATDSAATDGIRASKADENSAPATENLASDEAVDATAILPGPGFRSPANPPIIGLDGDANGKE